MKLEQLLEGVPFTLAQGSLDTEISDIIYDSRKAAPGLLFVCIVGTQRDSHEFAADCAAKGVSALVIQHDIDLSAMPGVTVVKVESSRCPSLGSLFPPQAAVASAANSCRSIMLSFPLRLTSAKRTFSG